MANSVKVLREKNWRSSDKHEIIAVTCFWGLVGSLVVAFIEGPTDGWSWLLGAILLGVLAITSEIDHVGAEILAELARKSNAVDEGAKTEPPIRT